ncbi:hypothetical protein FACS18942_02340 [Planctomycetales bacterium]|nr:hypothetical protein FACS18942_02340 [Planctomycetales bacterium]
MSSGGGFLDIGFTRFITPSWISVIWVISTVLEVISFLASFHFIDTMMEPIPVAYKAIIFLFGIVVDVIIHLFSLLGSRIWLELIIVVFKIEKNAREIGLLIIVFIIACFDSQPGLNKYVPNLKGQ